MKKWVAVFNSIFDEDNYSPITASDEKEYKETIDVYPFKDPQLEQVKWNQKLIHKNFQVLQSYAFALINKKPTCNAETWTQNVPFFCVFQESYPRAFPFSNMVPQVYCQVKQYIYACLKFSEDLHLRWD